jgi:hypothetical protein
VVYRFGTASTTPTPPASLLSADRLPCLRGLLVRRCDIAPCRSRAICRPTAGAVTAADWLSLPVRGILAALSEPGSVRTMCSLAAGDSALKAARPMTDPAISQAVGPAAITAARQPGQRPDANSFVLWIYSQTDKFAYSPLASLLPSANCPGRQRREPAGAHVALPAGRPGAEPARTTPTAHRLPEPAARPAHSGQWADSPVRCSHRLTCLTLNRSAGINVPAKPLTVTGPGRFLSEGTKVPPARDRHPCRGIPAPVILGLLLAFGLH